MAKLLVFCVALMIAKVVGLTMLELDMTAEIALKSSMFKLLLASVAVILVRLFLLSLDEAAGFKFKRWLNDTKTEDNAKAIYLAARFIGVCLLVGLIIS